MTRQTLSILCGIPIAIIAVWFWSAKTGRIKPLWLATAVLYAIVYFVTFHIWLKAF